MNLIKTNVNPKEWKHEGDCKVGGHNLENIIIRDNKIIIEKLEKGE